MTTTFIPPSKISQITHTTFFFIAFFLIFLAISAAPSSAKEMYIKPTNDIPIRRGQGTNYKIISMESSGAQVELLETSEEGYARVRLESGKEGWILKRFLDSKVPAEQIVESLQVENKKLHEQTVHAIKKEAESTASFEEAQEQLNRVLIERNGILEKYQQLQKDTADVIQLKRNQESTTKHNKQLRQEVLSLKNENILLKKEKNLYWFITGATVLAVGFLLGKLPGPRKKRSGYLV